MDKKVRQRAENFSENEKEILQTFIQDHLSVIESRGNDLKMIEKKKEAWSRVSESMQGFGYPLRSPKQLKEQWVRMKLNSTKADSSYKRQRLETGNKGPVKEPEELDFQNQRMIPEDFEEDSIEIDSNDIHEVIVFKSSPMDKNKENSEVAKIPESPMKMLKRLPRSENARAEIFSGRKRQIVEETRQNNKLFEIRMDTEKKKLEKVELEVSNMMKTEEREAELHRLRVQLLQIQIKKACGDGIFSYEPITKLESSE